MDDKAKFILVFETSLGATDEYEIPRANKALTAAELESLMDDMVSNTNFYTSEGSPTAPVSAVLVETSFTRYA